MEIIFNIVCAIIALCGIMFIFSGISKATEENIKYRALERELLIIRKILFGHRPLASYDISGLYPKPFEKEAGYLFPRDGGNINPPPENVKAPPPTPPEGRVIAGTN